MILDPDHVPFSNFLDEVLPHFEDDTIGFVQTVQAYYNYDESPVALGSAQQTFHFYGPVMMCMNAYGTVNAIGANCIFRREALDSIGGHAPGLSEDMHTAMQIHAKGWKSIYVPKVCTRGLTPASLTAYYKQQLKWSRGTLDLLTSVYPKLYKNFNWKQKLHYGLLPTHYLSGLIFLIGFLIPILSLVNASLPWRGNIINFGLIYTPIFVCLTGIHIYVQQWLLHKSERGLHILGGILMICTWWIYLLGFVYTVIGKKVPYLPTPKDSSGITNFKLLIPNLIVALASIFSIVYGLYIDFTPFTIFMSVFAAINAFFMLYTFRFAYEKPIAKKAIVENYDKPYSKTFKNASFNILNKSVTTIVVLVAIICGGFQYYGDHVKWEGVSPEVKTKNTISYLGTFTPKYDNGLTDLKLIQSKDDKYDLISLYLAWDKDIKSSFPKSLIDSIYMRNALPLITWEPWLNTFEEDKNMPDTNVYKLIESGYFDNYITEYANVLKNLNRPVFIRFAHEFDNPFYPWYITKKDSDSFKTAWVHVYEIFKKIEADNVIWIWNPWKAKNVASFYPGPDYVDWIGVNILNYGNFNKDKKNYSFENLYTPFHNEFKKLPDTPVIIAEFGSLKDTKESSKQEDWINNAFKTIEENFDKIKSLVYFNSKVDNNLPTKESDEIKLDWTITSKQTKDNFFSNKKVPDYILQPLKKVDIKKDSYSSSITDQTNFITGINLKKGYSWKKDYHVLTRKSLLSDFKKLSTIGVNTINYLGNSIYDYNVLNASEMNNINISYSFWIPESLDFVLDTLQSNALKNKILNKVKSLKDSKQIIRWHIKNDVLYNQKNFYYKPELLYQNESYVLWVKNLLNEIKKIDSTRSVVVDIEVNKQSKYHINYLLNYTENMDFFGLIVEDDEHLEDIISYMKEIKKPFILNEIDIETIETHKIIDRKIPFFVNQWQDKHESNSLDFKGLIDRKGRYKHEYFKLLSSIEGTTSASYNMYNILKPSSLLYSGETKTYHAMVYDKNKDWNRVPKNKELKIEWSLIKCDEFGNYLALKEIGTKPILKLTIPKSYNLYRLHLAIIKNDIVISSVITKLNTPSSF